MTSVDGKALLVTGAARGIGAASAKRLAAAVHFRFRFDEAPQRTRRRVTEYGPVSAGQQGRGLQSERSRSRMTDEVDVLVDAM